MSREASFGDAIRLHRNGRLREAEHICRGFLATQPNDAVALHFLGVLRYEQGDHKAAIELIGRAIALSPQNAPYRNNYGLLLQLLGRYADALDSFRRALEIRPQYPQALANLGMAQRSLGEHEAALASFAAALKLEPYHPDALSKLAALLGELGRPQEAIRLYEEGIRHAPCLEFYVNLGALRIATDRPDLAIVPLQEAIRLAPDCATAHLNLGMAQAALGNDAAALAALRNNSGDHNLLAPQWALWRRSTGLAGQRLNSASAAGESHATGFAAAVAEPRESTSAVFVK